MNEMIPVTPVILCGGSGTRLWPLSRAGYPKQFLCLNGELSLFQQAVQRLQRVGDNARLVGAPLVVCNDEHRFLAAEQLREIGMQSGGLLLEPGARNTAPALTLAALAAQQEGADPVLLVMPADHAVGDDEAFASALRLAVDRAVHGEIAILGIKPDRPETGYGYIQAASRECGAPAPVLRFVEKPDLDTARDYVQSGAYLWNAGIFVLKASVWLKALAKFRDDIAQALQASWMQRSRDENFVRPGKAEFLASPAESIDYAVLEHCPGSEFPVCVLPLDAGWSDLGAWDAVWQALPKDAHGNVHVGDVISVGASNSLVHATSRLVALVGLDDVAVIETPDAVLVVNRKRSQDIKMVVNRLQREGREEHLLHRKVHRPWGWYDSIDEGGRFKVKRIQVKPKASLSLQMHHHRAEHWIVVTGTAQITCGDKVVLLTENQSTYIPLGEAHRLCNPGTILLEIIEVQSGSYLGEDDIVRFEDRYGRTS
jgi:mannose-1-phosphate guanylyltransferase/mannose-6-phosphate isomerase